MVPQRGGCELPEGHLGQLRRERIRRRASVISSVPPEEAPLPPLFAGGASGLAAARVAFNVERGAFYVAFSPLVSTATMVSRLQE